MSKEHLTAAESATLTFYNQMSQEWVQSHSSERYWNTAFDRFHKLLPQGKIIEIGAGVGRDASELIKLGYDYIGTEPSPNFLELARINNPGALFLPRTAYDLGLPENFVDGFWASAVLLHLPKARVDLALDELYWVTRPGGVGFISLKYGQGEKIEGDGRLFSYYDFGEFDPYLEAAGFQIPEKIIWPAGRYATWQIYFVQAKK